MSYAELAASNPDVYPDYCVGAIYITTPGTAAAIVKVAQQMRFFWVDDAWVTGYIAGRLNISHQVFFGPLLGAYDTYDFCRDPIFYPLFYLIGVKPILD